MHNILIFDTDSLSHRDLLEIIHELIGDWSEPPVITKDMDQFKTTLQKCFWDLVFIDFQTPAFWEMAGIDLNPFLEDVKSQSKLVIGITGDMYQKKILLQHEIHIIYKTYQTEQLRQALGLNRKLRLKTICNLVCKRRNIDPTIVMQRNRKDEIVMTRHIVLYLATKFSKQTLKEIGQFAGERDHTTVIHSRDTIKDLISKDETLRKEVVEFVKELQKIREYSFIEAS